MNITPEPPAQGDEPLVPTDLAQIRRVAECLPQLVWSCRASGYCDYLNRRWVEYTGVAEETHHGQGWLEAVHPDDREGIRQVWESFVAGEGEYDVEYRLRRHDGNYLWFKARGAFVDDPSGSPRRVLGTTTDIDPQKRAEQQAREIAERASFVRQAAGVGFWYCDLPFDVLEWDERVKEHFHLPPSARVTIDTFYERIHPDDREATRQAIERSIATRQEYDVHYRTVHPKTGAVKWIRSIGRSFVGSDGTPIRFDGVSLDVTEQRQAEGRATAILESISDAFYALDHEWRFTYINGEAERLLGRRRDELVGRNIWVEFPPAVGTEFERYYRQAASERTAITFEAYYPPLGHWYELNAYPSVDGISVYFREIDDRRATALHLTEVAAANAKFRARRWRAT